MAHDAEAQEAYPPVTSPAPRQGPMADRAQRSGLAGEENVDPDAAVVEEAGSAAAGPATAGARPASSIPEAARPQAAANGDTGLGGDPELMQERWAIIQATFVDDPRGSVAAAAELVNEAIAGLVASAEERERGLRGEWEREGVDTEGLRNTLRSYRGLLDRLVAL